MFKSVMLAALLWLVSTSVTLAVVRQANTLNAFVQQTLANNPGVQAAQASLDAARAQLQAASQPLYNPELAVDVEKNSDHTTSIGINQTLDWGDKQGARASIADKLIRQQQAQLNAIRLRLSAELLTALADYQTTHAMKQLAQKRAALMQQVLEMAKARRQAGDVNAIDLQLTRLAAIQANIELANVESRQSGAIQKLVAVTGKDYQRWPALSFKFPPIPAFDAEKRLMSLPEIQLQQAKVATARSNIKLQQQSRQPDPTLGLRGGRDGSANLIGLSVSVPLYIRNSYKAEVKVANAELINAQRKANDLFQRAKAKLRYSAERYQLANKAWQTWLKSGQPSIDSNLEQLRHVWRVGELSTTDYLVQIKQALDTQASAIKLHGRVWSAWFDWLTASGDMKNWLDRNPS